MSEKDEDEIWVDIETIEEISRIRTYLAKHNVIVTSSEIVDVAITLAKRMGAGNWSFVCELRHRKKRNGE